MSYNKIEKQPSSSLLLLPLLLEMLGSSIKGSIYALIITGIVVAGIWLLAAPPVMAGLLPLLPLIFITVAWTGAGVRASFKSLVLSITTLLQMPDSSVGWLALGIGFIGLSATIGAAVGTFFPVPILGTLVGAASGAVIGVLAGVAAWAFSSIVGAIVIAVKTKKEGRYERFDNTYYNTNQAVNTSGYVIEFRNEEKPPYSTKSLFGKSYVDDGQVVEIVDAEKIDKTSSFNIF